MAKPHGKILRGVEGGNDCQHWYDWLQSRRRILRSGKWQGSRTKTKPGIGYVASWYLHPDHKKLGTWDYMIPKEI